PDARLEPIVAGFGDPRVRYVHHGFGDAELNLRGLWRATASPDGKPLFDHDPLFQGPAQGLVRALQGYPESGLAFHERVFIEAADEMVGAPSGLLEPGVVALVDHTFLAGNMVAKLDNFVGEPSNTMLRRELVEIETAYTYGSLKLDFLADVA